jgi:hypothetical protein
MVMGIPILTSVCWPTARNAAGQSAIAHLAVEVSNMDNLIGMEHVSHRTDAGACSQRAD